MNLCWLVHYLKGLWLGRDAGTDASSCQTLNFLLRKPSQQSVSLRAVIFVEASLLLTGCGTVGCTEECFVRALYLQEVLPVVYFIQTKQNSCPTSVVFIGKDNQLVPGGFLLPEVPLRCKPDLLSKLGVALFLLLWLILSLGFQGYSGWKGPLRVSSLTWPKQGQLWDQTSLKQHWCNYKLFCC